MAQTLLFTLIREGSVLLGFLASRLGFAFVGPPYEARCVRPGWRCGAVRSGGFQLFGHVVAGLQAGSWVCFQILLKGETQMSDAPPQSKAATAPRLSLDAWAVFLALLAAALIRVGVIHRIPW